VRLTGAAYFDFDLSSPWVLESPSASEIAGRVMPGAERVVEYHLVARGSAWEHAVGHEPVRLREGDLIVRVAPAPRRRAGSRRCRRCRLRIGSGVQPRVQETGRQAAASVKESDNAITNWR
jgi:hypothetical protein